MYERQHGVGPMCCRHLQGRYEVVWCRTYCGGTSSFYKKFSERNIPGSLQLAATALIWRYTCNCGLLSDLQDPTYEADSRSSADIPHLKRNFDVNFTAKFGGVVSCLSVIVFACILSMNIYLK